MKLKNIRVEDYEVYKIIKGTLVMGHLKVGISISDDKEFWCLDDKVPKKVQRFLNRENNYLSICKLVSEVQIK